ncbi:HlyD family secretion protein [Parerythrobacter aestuarii]|uniref:HlyD family secretion protein n=1 Tax=Parerythrobacter aestuarii TaxID=3020909 RepID=UPI0024DE5E93|nr:HlyD family secretion protein [Parerythrobacter aestuarii]
MAEADPTVVQDQAPAEAQSDAPPRSKRRWGRIVLMVSLPLALALGALTYWWSLQGKVSTDNAYIQQDRVAISSEVGGRIVEVLVGEGDTVKAGQLLYRLDEEPFRVEIAEANATIAQAQANLTALGNDADLSGAAISAAQEDIAFAEANFARKDALYKRGFLTLTEHDAARHAVSQAREQLRMAQARQTEARARLARGPAVPDKDPQVAAGEARKASAELNLRRTEVRSPSAGTVTQADRLQVGQQVVQGLPVLTLVEDGSSYVEANFKETDLADMVVGQRAEIRLDAYPDVVLEGRVETIGAGTGSEFSVLPAQNATGNWVKVTQRVPVRIRIDSKSPRRLIAGLSTEVTVFTDED